MNSKPLDVYLVDDDSFGLSMLESILVRQGCKVRVSTSPEEALKEIEAAPPNVLLTDWNMPGMNGGELCQVVRHMDLPRYVYTIVLTANAQDFVVEALDAGADDFVTKPVDPDELAARLNAGRRILELEHKLKVLSERDGLTGLLNRPTFFKNFENAFEVAEKNESKLTVVMLDLDNFKTINDVYGHLAGDQVLRKVGEILRQSAFDGVILGRYGGEEFIVGLAGWDQATAQDLAKDVQCRLASHPFDFGSGQGYRVTASFGITEHDGSFQNNAQLINSADQNLLMAKRLGRDQAIAGRFETHVKTNHSSKSDEAGVV